MAAADQAVGLGAGALELRVRTPPPPHASAHPPNALPDPGKQASILGPGLLLPRCFPDLDTEHPLAQVLLDLD